MSKIRKSARGKQCLVRIPGVCNFNESTVIAAHLRIAGTCGVGMKQIDLLTVRACSSCHDVIDGRVWPKGLKREDLVLYVHEAHCRTLIEYEKEGLICKK